MYQTHTRQAWPAVSVGEPTHTGERGGWLTRRKPGPHWLLGLACLRPAVTEPWQRMKCPAQHLALGSCSVQSIFVEWMIPGHKGINRIWRGLQQVRKSQDVHQVRIRKWLHNASPSNRARGRPWNISNFFTAKCIHRGGKLRKWARPTGTGVIPNRSTELLFGQQVRLSPH